MRAIGLVCLLFASCSAPDNGAAPAGAFSANARDGLCIAGGESQRAGFILYGQGQANCSARGALVADGEGFALIPQGETRDTCRFRIEQTGGGVALAGSSGDCAYYCGAGAAIRRTEFRTTEAREIVDLGGDPLC